MNASELKYHVEQTGKETHFFTRSSMKFFGDTMRNYGVRSAVVTTNYDTEGNYVGKDGVTVDCWELYRKRPVKCGNQKSAFFSKADYSRIHPAIEN